MPPWDQACLSKGFLDQSAYFKQTQSRLRNAPHQRSPTARLIHWSGTGFGNLQQHMWSKNLDCSCCLLSRPEFCQRGSFRGVNRGRAIRGSKLPGKYHLECSDCSFSTSTPPSPPPLLPGISTEQGISSCNKTRHMASYQGWMRQPSRREKISRAGKSQRQPHPPC